MFKKKEKIRFYDCDPAGILFFGNIFKIIHSAYEDFISSLQLKQNYFIDEDIVFPIVHSKADFFSPLKLNNDVTISLKVLEIKTTSFRILFSVYNQESKLMANVETVHVTVSKDLRTKTETPTELKEKLKLYQI